MLKHPVTIPDHPAEKKSSRGASDGSGSSKTAVKQTDSRDDEQVRFGPDSIPSPGNVSSAAAAAAAAAASFAAANANSSNMSGSKRRYDGVGDEASSTNPPQKQGRTARKSSKLGDGGNTGAWPISPIDDDKKDEAPAVTSSSSAGLSPIKFEGTSKDGEQQDGEEPLMDFSASPLGPPEIQNSNRNDHSFSPKNFFGVSRFVFDSTNIQIAHTNIPFSSPALLID